MKRFSDHVEWNKKASKLFKITDDKANERRKIMEQLGNQRRSEFFIITVLSIAAFLAGIYF